MTRLRAHIHILLDPDVDNALRQLASLHHTTIGGEVERLIIAASKSPRGTPLDNINKHNAHISRDYINRKLTNGWKTQG